MSSWKFPIHKILFERRIRKIKFLEIRLFKTTDP